MATSRAELAEDWVLFDCPRCGVHYDGPLTVKVESESMDWQLGLFDAGSAFVRQTMVTSACGDVFVTRSIGDEPTWEVSLLSFGDARPSRLHVIPRNVSQR